MFNIIKLNEKDNIGIASMDIPENVDTNLNFKSKDRIPYGHKIALKKLTQENMFIDMVKSLELLNMKLTKESMFTHIT